MHTWPVENSPKLSRSTIGWHKVSLTTRVYSCFAHMLSALNRLVPDPQNTEQSFPGSHASDGPKGFF